MLYRNVTAEQIIILALCELYHIKWHLYRLNLDVAHKGPAQYSSHFRSYSGTKFQTYKHGCSRLSLDFKLVRMGVNIVMIAHSTRTRNSSSLFLFLLLGLSLLTVAVIWARLTSLNPNSPAKFDFQTYSNSKYHFVVSYPQNWQLQTATGEANIVTLSSFPVQSIAAGGSLHNASLPLNMSKIDILAYDVEVGTTAQNLLEAQTGAVAAMQSSTSSFQFDGQKAIKVSVPTAPNLLDGNESNLTYTSIYVTNGTHGFIIAGYAAPALFDQIINSFHVN